MKAYENIPLPKLIFGSGSCSKVGAALVDYSVTKCLIITGPSMTKRGYVGKVGDSLDNAGIKWEVFDKTMPDPTDGCVLEAAAVIKSGNFDGVIGLGGGSPMDVAKAACMVAGFDEPVTKLYDYRRGLGEKARNDWRRKIALVTMPTTAGTGAEVTATGVITDTETHQKFSFGNWATVADVTIVDPEFTLNMPAKATATTALDALCHCVEILVGSAQSEFTNLVLFDCVERIIKWLPVAVSEPANLEAREQLSWAAHNALANGGMPNGHALAHAIGSLYGIVHGHACIMVLPTVIRHHAQFAADSIARLAEIMGVDISTTEANAENVAQKVKSLYKSFGLEPLREYFSSKNINESDEEFAIKAAEMTLTDFKSQTWNPPIHNSVQDCEKVCLMVLHDY